ncbi:hypothetical protein BSZ22_01420 [Bradyrhizobium canariense]|uniref:Uncharacterized protein n=1 Tax=Bradyrhizobium canariense TaxID=255045 RepID=A0A1X3H555_9BRAD|nr:hypothetical protein BSZ23_32140 [Bradyrhizobium canariense]OSI79820.1 hypothetical protein BSZ22_01420 [Bradyrhizobium canariense]OSI83440.1 hypothetical protein BSZ24_36650 [Bradyrhizobium canariense]OSI96837.1 hypothetical protein BSZ25_01215 [Bradyrhizobium canariense]OSI98454.1 hypothetical protein BSZ16_31720 [Bradyrhizobium canariense]
MRCLLLVAAIFFSGTNAIHAACYAPSAPDCAERYSAFDDQDEFDRCRREMTNYQIEAQEFLACIRRETEELKRKSDGVIDEYNNAVEGFNRRARG